MAQDARQTGGGEVPRPQAAVKSLRHELIGADDPRIMRVLGVVEQTSDPTVNQMLLDPLRPRLAVLKPPRPPRFARLLFTPLDPLIVSARAWRPGDPTVPRTVVAPFSRMVRAGMGVEATRIDTLIRSYATVSSQQVVTACETLWARGAEILADAPMPDEWIETGLRPETFRPLAGGVAAVLRLARRLSMLDQDAAVGALPVEDAALNLLPREIAAAPPEGAALLISLIVVRLPHLMPILRQLGSAGDKARLKEAVARGIEGAMDRMEGPDGFALEVRNAPLAETGNEVKRLLTLFRELEDDADFRAHRPRLRAVREKLDMVCQSRFAAGLKDHIAAPLAAAADGSIDREGQLRLEESARGLRGLETVARRIGGAANYDRMVEQTMDILRDAAADGSLSRVRMIRLIEILSGPEAAEAEYRMRAARV